MNDLSIIIVNWNTEKVLKECLSSVYRETKNINFRIVVVDNNSSDNSVKMIEENFPEVMIIKNSSNRGFSAANNQGLKLANSRAILLLNPDTIVIENAIPKMYKKLINSDYGLLTCKLLNPDKSLQKSVYPFYSFWRTITENRFTDFLFSKLKLKTDKIKQIWNHDKTIEIDWARGAVLMMKKKTFDLLGFLDERFFVYGEEIDYYFRARKAGIKSLFFSEVKIIHIGKCSSRQNKSEMFIQNYRSLFQLLKKHYSQFDYLLYRVRSVFLIFLWYLYYGGLAVFNKDKNQFDVYKKTLLWQLNFERIT